MYRSGYFFSANSAYISFNFSVGEFTLSTQRLHATYTNALDQLCEAFGVKKKNESQFDENEAVMIMSNAIAYYDLAFRRYADITAMAIEDMLFNAFTNNIDAVIRKKLNLFNSSEKEIKMLLQEDTSIAVKRERVIARLNRLQQTAKELRIVLPEQYDVENDLDLYAVATKPKISVMSDFESEISFENHENDDVKKEKKKKKKFLKLF